MVYINLVAGNICNKDVLAEMEIDDKIVNVDNNYMDPQLCATIALIFTSNAMLLCVQCSAAVVCAV